MYVYLRMAIYRNFKLNERIYIHFKFAHVLKFSIMDPHYLTIDLLNVTVAMTDKDRLLTDVNIKSCTVVEFASGKAHA